MMAFASRSAVVSGNMRPDVIRVIAWKNSMPYCQEIRFRSEWRREKAYLVA